MCVSQRLLDAALLALSIVGVLAAAAAARLLSP